MDGLNAIEARVAELQGMLASLAPPVSPSASFASVLDQVQTQAGPTSATPAPLASSRAPATAPASAGQALADGSTPAAPGTMTRTSWAKDLLTRLQVPVTASNLSAVVSWEMAEGGYWNNTATFNPLNTTQREPGSSAMNSVGVQAYTDYETGMQATVETLHNGDYGGILSALQQGTSAEAVRQAVVTSPWGTSASAFAPSLLATGDDVVAGRSPDSSRPR